MQKTNSYVLLGAFSIAFLKSLILSPTYQDVAVIAVICTVFAYLEHRSRDKELDALNLAVTNHQAAIKDLENKVSSIKFVQATKPSALATPFNPR